MRRVLQVLQPSRPCGTPPHSPAVGALSAGLPECTSTAPSAAPWLSVRAGHQPPALFGAGAHPVRGQLRPSWCLLPWATTSSSAPLVSSLPWSRSGNAVPLASTFLAPGKAALPLLGRAAAAKQQHPPSGGLAYLLAAGQGKRGGADGGRWGSAGLVWGQLALARGMCQERSAGGGDGSTDLGTEGSRTCPLPAGLRRLLLAGAQLCTLAWSAAALYDCYVQAAPSQVPYTGRTAITSPAMLEACVQESNNQHEEADERHKQAGFLDFYMPHYVLQWMDEKYAARMRQLGMQLVRAAAEGGGGGAYEHVGRMKWEFVVTSAWEVYHNAGVACTAKVLVHYWFLYFMDLPDTELAAVLAHEIAHVLAQHHVEYEIYSQALLALWGFAAVVISALPRVTARVKVQYCFAAGSTAWALNNTFHGRPREYEADAIGMRLLARAGTDPGGMVALLERLSKHEAPLLYPWSTHPPTWLRVRAAKELLPAAMEEYHVHKQQGRVVAAGRQQRQDRTA